MKRWFAALLAVALLCAGAMADSMICTGGAGLRQYALAAQGLFLRETPSPEARCVGDIGTYPVENRYIAIDGRYWDEVNEIWWLLCSFYYNGSEIRGWTGAKRFDSSGYDLYALAEYRRESEIRGGSGNQYTSGTGWYNGATGGTQQARATTNLSLRGGPGVDYEDLGTFKMEGRYVTLSAKHWDAENALYWLRCSFEYNGVTITGWTGAKRFDSSGYDLDALPDW